MKLQKAACHDGDRVDMLGGLDCKDDLDKIFSYIVGLKYTAKVDYQFIYDHLKQAATSCKADLNAPFDWEQQEPEPSTANTTATVHTAQTKLRRPIAHGLTTYLTYLCRWILTLANKPIEYVACL